MAIADRLLNSKRSKVEVRTWAPPGAASGAARAEEPARDPVRSVYQKVRDSIQQKLLAEVDGSLSAANDARLRLGIETLFNNTLDEAGIILSRAERTRLLEDVTAELLAYGPIDPLLQDDSVSEVMVNGPHQVWVERDGILYETDIKFENTAHVMRIIDRIIAPLGRRCDESSPMVDARLPDGSRVNAIIPPLSLVGPVLTVRKFHRIALKDEDIVKFGMATAELMQFLHACVTARLNMILSGGTGSGKTTLLNILSAYIPSSERIITIEDAAELQLQQRHVITLEKRPANIEGKGEVTIRDLVINALRMRPDRIVVGECRGGEALDMLQVMNTGHEGSMTTVHANSPRDTLKRVETMALMAGFDMPLRAVREQIVSAIDLIIHTERMSDGVRRVTLVSEVQGLEGDVPVMQDIFLFKQEGMADGKIVGKLVPTGIRPKFMTKLLKANVSLPPNVFGYEVS